MKAVVPYFWPALVAVGLLAVLSFRLTAAQAPRLWLLGSAQTIAASIGTIVIMQRDYTSYTVGYDCVGSLIANGLAILFATGIGVGLTRRGASPPRRAVAVACAALFTLAGPWIVLAVHCLSGDCL